jgi:hypothetical protein
MEKLEEKIDVDKGVTKNPPKTYEPLYQGLQKIEEESLGGKTSIKYWM